MTKMEKLEAIAALVASWPPYLHCTSSAKKQAEREGA